MANSLRGASQAPPPRPMVHAMPKKRETALHTAGMYPERLAAVLPLLDWVRLDIKAPAGHDDVLTATPGSGGRVSQSLDLLLASGTVGQIQW